MLLLLAFACTPDEDPGPAPPPDTWGPYAVGATTRTLADPRGKVLTIEVWYPAVEGTGEPGPYPPLTLSLDALRDADPAPPPPGGWPKVAFSHGNIAIRFQSAFLTEHLASHGFVVIAPDHAGNTLVDIDIEGTPQMLVERAGDVSGAVDAILDEASRGGRFGGGFIEPGDYAVMGHSLGAFTSLVVGGGGLDLQSAVDFCDAGGESPACSALTPELPALAQGEPTTDDRVVATIAMSPVAWFAFGPDGVGLQSVREPLIIGGRRDEITPYDTEIAPVYERLSSPKRLLTFDGAGHYSFSDICLLVPALFDECDPDAGFTDLDRVQTLTKVAVTSYLKVHLEGDARYAPWLEPAFWEGEAEVELTADP